MWKYLNFVNFLASVCFELIIKESLLDVRLFHVSNQGFQLQLLWQQEGHQVMLSFHLGRFHVLLSYHNAQLVTDNCSSMTLAGKRRYWKKSILWKWRGVLLLSCCLSEYWTSHLAVHDSSRYNRGWVLAVLFKDSTNNKPLFIYVWRELSILVSMLELQGGLCVCRRYPY